jgi:hypothetical protein
MGYLDGMLVGACRPWPFPRGYFDDVMACGCEQLIPPEHVQSAEEAATPFASDVATGFLEELCDTLDPQRAARMHSDLGL